MKPSKQTIIYIVLIVGTLVLADQIRKLPVVNKLPTV